MPAVLSPTHQVWRHRAARNCDLLPRPPQVGDHFGLSCTELPVQVSAFRRRQANVGMESAWLRFTARPGRVHQTTSYARCPASSWSIFVRLKHEAVPLLKLKYDAERRTAWGCAAALRFSYASLLLTHTCCACCCCGLSHRWSVCMSYWGRPGAAVCHDTHPLTSPPHPFPYAYDTYGCRVDEEVYGSVAEALGDGLPSVVAMFVVGGAAASECTCVATGTVSHSRACTAKSHTQCLMGTMPCRG